MCWPEVLLRERTLLQIDQSWNSASGIWIFPGFTLYAKFCTRQTLLLYRSLPNCSAGENKTTHTHWSCQLLCPHRNGSRSRTATWKVGCDARNSCWNPTWCRTWLPPASVLFGQKQLRKYNMCNNCKNAQERTLSNTKWTTLNSSLLCAWLLGMKGWLSPHSKNWRKTNAVWNILKPWCCCQPWMERTFYQEGFSHAFMLSNYPPLDMDGLANLEVFNYHLRTFLGRTRQLLALTSFVHSSKTRAFCNTSCFFSIVEASQKMQRIFWTQSLPNNITRHREGASVILFPKRRTGAQVISRNKVVLPGTRSRYRLISMNRPQKTRATAKRR